MTNQEKISLLFNQEEETYSIFPLEDLIKEYNYKISITPACFKNHPLSLRPLNTIADNPFMQAMTKREIETMRIEEIHEADYIRLKKVIRDQVYTPAGFLGNIPNIITGVSMLEMLNVLGLKGKVYYKKVGNKTYVILKGYAGDRSILKGTRYLNTHPEIVRLGLAKLSFVDLTKAGLKVSIWVYAGIKAVEAVKLCFIDKKGFEPSFFASAGTDIPKLVIGSLVSAGAGVGVVALGIPVAAGVGIVLLISVGTAIALDYADQKAGLTEKLNEAANTMWINLKKSWNSYSNSMNKVSLNSDMSDGLIFGGSSLRLPEIIRNGEQYIYAAQNSGVLC
jgi:hypothetical protein